MKCPFPHYWICHICVALLIAAVFWPILGLDAGLVIGVSFYAGREVAQYQSTKVFDWWGIGAPAVACFAVLILGKVIGL